jgi:hypothetical protein
VAGTAFLAAARTSNCKIVDQIWSQTIRIPAHSEEHVDDALLNNWHNQVVGLVIPKANNLQVVELNWFLIQMFEQIHIDHRAQPQILLSINLCS